MDAYQYDEDEKLKDNDYGEYESDEYHEESVESQEFEYVQDDDYANYVDLDQEYIGEEGNETVIKYKNLKFCPGINIAPSYLFYKIKRKNKSDKYVIFTSCDIKKKRYIYYYNIKKNKWRKFCRFPNHKFSNNGQSIDKINGKIFIFSSYKKIKSSYSDTSNNCAILDIATKKWEILKIQTKYDKIQRYPSSVYISSPINKLHIFSENRHFRLEKSTKKQYKFTKTISYSIGPVCVNDSSLIYVPKLKQLFAFRIHYDTRYGKQDLTAIIYCNINDTKQKKFNWRFYRSGFLEHNTKSDTMSFILIFKYIIFIFSSKTRTIYCINLLNKKKYISKKLLPPWKDLHFNVLKIGCYIHLFSKKKHKHLRVNVCEILPKELLHVLSEPLTYGYIICAEKECRFMVPVYLSKIILRYVGLLNQGKNSCHN